MLLFLVLALAGEPTSAKAAEADAVTEEVEPGFVR